MRFELKNCIFFAPNPGLCSHVLLARHVSCTTWWKWWDVGRSSGVIVLGIRKAWGAFNKSLPDLSKMGFRTPGSPNLRAKTFPAQCDFWRPFRPKNCGNLGHIQTLVLETKGGPLGGPRSKFIRFQSASRRGSHKNKFVCLET